MILCWSAKGGSGTTVTACALAIEAVSGFSGGRSALLVDLGGDACAALGCAEPGGPGVADWLASPDAPAAQLAALAVSTIRKVAVVRWGPRERPIALTNDVARRLALALAEIEASGVRVVVDCGAVIPPEPLRAAARASLLITRACYLALRRAVRLPTPSGVVLVGEAHRSLTARDVANALGAQVVAEVSYDPAVARAVDAGLLAADLPRTLSRPLARLALGVPV